LFKLVPALAKALCLCVLVLGAGCTRFHPQPLAPEAAAADFQNRSLADPGLRGFIDTNLSSTLSAWPLPAWGFTNLTLAAFYYHPDLDVARAKWAVATAGKKTAGERPNPSLSVSPAYNSTTRIPSPWLVTPTLDIPLETAGKRGYRLAQASQLSEVARLNIMSVAWQVRSRVRRSLVELFSARETLALLQAQRALQAENLRLLEQQQQAGAIPAFEVTQARIGADTTQLAFRDAERQNGEALAKLADAIGVPSRALNGVELSVAGLEGVATEVSTGIARRQALLNRADILGALAEYAASESALQLEIAKQYPDIHLNPGYEFDQGDNKWSLGLTVTLPVLNQNQGLIAEAEARRTAAAANFNALQARVSGEIDRATAGYRGALVRQQEAVALLTHARQQEKAGRDSFEAGAISRSELAAQRLQLNASELARLEAVVKTQQAFSDLEDALQSPLVLPETIPGTTANPRPGQPREIKP